HRRGEVPGGDGGSHTDGLLLHQDALVTLMPRDDIAVDPFGFLGEPFDEGGRIGDLPPGFGQRLALLGSHDFRQILLVTHDQLEPAAQYGGALLGGTFAPGRLCSLSRLDGAAGFLRSHVRHAAQFLAVGGVEDIGSPALAGLAPDTVDKGLLAEQFGGWQYHGILLLCGGVTHLPRPRFIFRTCYAERDGQTSGGEKKARAGAGSYRAARPACARSCTVLFDLRWRATHDGRQRSDQRLVVHQNTGRLLALFEQAGHALQAGQQHQLLPVGQPAEALEEGRRQQRRFGLDDRFALLGERQVHLALVTLAAYTAQQFAAFQTVDDGTQGRLGHADLFGQGTQGTLAGRLNAV